MIFNSIDNLPAEGELVLVTNGKDIAIAEFVISDKGKSFEVVLLPADGTITGWAPLPTIEL
jgi:hypothetical protein